MIQLFKLKLTLQQCPNVLMRCPEFFSACPEMDKLSTLQGSSLHTEGNYCGNATGSAQSRKSVNNCYWDRTTYHKLTRLHLLVVDRSKRKSQWFRRKRNAPYLRNHARLAGAGYVITPKSKPTNEASLRAENVNSLSTDYFSFGI
jgi:hypothetical protein